MNWQEHDGFRKEYKAIAKKQHSLDSDFKKVKKLLETQFNPENPKQVIAPGKIHRVSNSDENYSIWKVEVLVSGVKPNLWPRMWFAVSGDTFTLLAIGVHNNNYDNNEMDRTAINRYSDIA